MFIGLFSATFCLLFLQGASFVLNCRLHFLRQRQGNTAVNSEKRIDGGDIGLYNPGNIGQFYTTNMDISGTAAVVKSFDRIARDVLRADMEILSANYSTQQDYLDTIGYKLSQCVEHGDAVGREMELRMLKEFLSTKGSLSFVSGGPSVGKSKLMNQAIKDVTARGNPTKVKVILLDGRDVESLPDALAKKAGKNKKLLNAFASIASSNFLGALKKPDAVALAECVAALAHNIPRGTSHCVLVLDEANRFLDHKAAPETLKLFDSLVKQTKQTMLMSAVLLSSDDGMPFRLREIGIQTDHLTQTLLVGEIAPAQMLATLESWGVGEHLRHLLVQIYGGHLWHIRSAINTMRICGDISLEVEQEGISSIRSAFGQWKKAGGDRAELVAVLKEVARSNFCELDSADERAQLLTKCNVCTYLVDGAREFFLDPAVRQRRCGVVASTQLVRVLIASVLQEYDGTPDSE